MIQFENALVRYLNDSSLGLPYWDWSEREESWINLVSPIDMIDYNNQWSFGYNPITGYETERYPAEFKSKQYSKKIQNAKCKTDFFEFYPILEQLHATIHRTIDGDMGYLESAAFDPIFFLNHNFVEKVFEEWQLCRNQANDTVWFDRYAISS